jgi:hypothetical protein
MVRWARSADNLGGLGNDRDCPDYHTDELCAVVLGSLRSEAYEQIEIRTWDATPRSVK